MSHSPCSVVVRTSRSDPHRGTFLVYWRTRTLRIVRRRMLHGAPEKPGSAVEELLPIQQEMASCCVGADAAVSGQEQPETNSTSDANSVVVQQSLVGAK